MFTRGYPSHGLIWSLGTIPHCQVCQAACWCTSGERRARPRPDVFQNRRWRTADWGGGRLTWRNWWLFIGENDGKHEVNIWDISRINWWVLNDVKCLNGPIFPENVVVEKLSLFWINAATPEQPSLVHIPAKWKSRATYCCTIRLSVISIMDIRLL